MLNEQPPLAVASRTTGGELKVPYDPDTCSSAQQSPFSTNHGATAGDQFQLAVTVTPELCAPSAALAQTPLKSTKAGAASSSKTTSCLHRASTTLSAGTGAANQVHQPAVSPKVPAKPTTSAQKALTAAGQAQKRPKNAAESQPLAANARASSPLASSEQPAAGRRAHPVHGQQRSPDGVAWQPSRLQRSTFPAAAAADQPQATETAGAQAAHADTRRHATTARPADVQGSVANKPLR